MFFDIALFAYLIDKYFGEFPIKHMMVWVGEFIQAHRGVFTLPWFCFVFGAPQFHRFHLWLFMFYPFGVRNFQRCTNPEGVKRE